jgi:hypothetical protein
MGVFWVEYEIEKFIKREIGSSNSEQAGEAS